MIVIENLSKSFGEKIVLDKLSCQIKESTIYGIIGVNGAGKSTLLRTINGIYMQDSGTILIDGENIVDNENLKQSIAFVPDEFYFFYGYKLIDLAKFYQSLYKRFDMNRFNQIIQVLGLNPKEKISTFSKGMKRQSALACALSTRAKYMFFDETFDGLDPIKRNDIKAILKQIAHGDGTTIVLTSHNLKEVEDVCDDMGILTKGNLSLQNEIQIQNATISKLQVAFYRPVGEQLIRAALSRANINQVIECKVVARVATIIFKGNASQGIEALKPLNPALIDELKLSLEETFVYEKEEFENVSNRK